MISKRLMNLDGIESCWHLCCLNTCTTVDEHLRLIDCIIPILLTGDRVDGWCCWNTSSGSIFAQLGDGYGVHWTFMDNE